MPMDDFVRITPQGQFSLAGKRWMCSSTIYFGRWPGACHNNWLADTWWSKNEAMLDWDFATMAKANVNHAAIFFPCDELFDNGLVTPKAWAKMDRVVEAAKKSGVRISIFVGPFIDNPAIYKRVTGLEWQYDNRWLPTFNPHLHEAYVLQIKPFAERYRDEPTVMAYTDRIDRYYKGFDNVSIPFNLKDEWHDWLRTRYGRFANLMEAVGGPGRLENHPQDWKDVLLPQESKWNASMKNPLAYDFILMQKSNVGDAHARFDAAINKIAPNQFCWTPFEGNTHTWAMLDGFSPVLKKLQAIWMEYYYFENTRPSLVQPVEEWAHTPEMLHHRMAHELPIVYNAAYMMVRYLKRATQIPVVMCHGSMVSPAHGIENNEQAAAVIDRVNAALIAGDGDGWHSWCWHDDWQSGGSHQAEQLRDTTDYYFHGETTGYMDFPDCNFKPAFSTILRYGEQLQRIAAKNPPPKKGEVLLLSSAARMYNLFRRLAYPTAAAMSGALTRLGVECDYLWTAQDDDRITQEMLDSYKLVVMADNMFSRDFRDTPDKLLAYVQQGGTLVFAMSRPDRFEDEHGNEIDSPALRTLSGVDANGRKDWPGAGKRCVNWPASGDAAWEPNADALAFPRVIWGVTPEFRHFATYPIRNQFLGFRSTDGDTFTVVEGLVDKAEVIAVAKFPAGSRPFVWRHPVGKGWVYVNAWTNNLYRDSERSADYGGCDYDWLLHIPLVQSKVEDIDLTRGAALWLRNDFGWFWREK
ncbi:MAG: hypothetical protein FWE88_00350 [Phycisphaerae bacterium]|nr:hypothetical protein [Phycisphaerae bacterium]